MKAIGMTALPLLCFYIPFQGCSAIMIAVLQGLGEGKRAMAAGLCERLLFPLAVMYLFALTGSLDAVWRSFTIAEVLGLLICLLLTRQAYTKKVQTL
jgi:Na+-driven multidrug efflux pump